MKDKEKVKKVFLVAGGTAGHINGAIALSEVLAQNGYQSQFISSQRKIDYRVLKDYHSNSWHLNSKALKGKGKIETIKNIFFNLIVFVQVLLKTIFNRPQFAIGFGGFICGPSLLACRLLGVQFYVVEQNSVMGMANKLLVPFSQKVFTHFKSTINFPLNHQDKMIISGNPIKSSIRYTAPKYIERESVGSINLLVFGGSLGAKEINEVINIFISEFSKNNLKISIKHQVGQGKDLDMPQHDQITYKQMDYIDNMNEAYAWSDAIISRGGASTISELEIIKKPCLIFPYPHVDEHQLHNAKMLREKSHFIVEYIEVPKKQSQKQNETQYKVQTLNHFIESVLSTPYIVADQNNIEKSAAQTVFENIQRDFS